MSTNDSRVFSLLCYCRDATQIHNRSLIHSSRRPYMISWKSLISVIEEGCTCGAARERVLDRLLLRSRLLTKTSIPIPIPNKTKTNTTDTRPKPIQSIPILEQYQNLNTNTINTDTDLTSILHQYQYFNTKTSILTLVLVHTYTKVSIDDTTLCVILSDKIQPFTSSRCWTGNVTSPAYVTAEKGSSS